MREGSIRKDDHSIAYEGFNFPRLTGSGIH
nr:MAG TPA: hypothetical protein [Caudoviricetes sp.]